MVSASLPRRDGLRVIRSGLDALPAVVKSPTIADINAYEIRASLLFLENSNCLDETASKKVLLGVEGLGALVLLLAWLSVPILPNTFIQVLVELIGIEEEEDFQWYLP